MAQDDYSKMMAPNAADDLHDGRPADMQMRPSQRDGLPVPLPQASFDTPPGLTHDNLICMADTRSFVRRNAYGEVSDTFTPDIVKRRSDGTYYVPLGQNWIDVEPIRPQCQHYLRQMTDLSDDRTKRFIQRVCLAQRSETGEHVSLRDLAVFACTLRAPRHLESEQQLDDFDARLLADATAKAEMAEFDVDAELAKQSLGVLSK